MVTAIVLVNARRDAVNETAQALLALSGVAEVYSVAGEWDLVVMVRAKTNEELAELITNHMLRIDSIVRTQTLVAFRAYSNYDLDRMFSIGFENET